MSAEPGTPFPIRRRNACALTETLADNVPGLNFVNDQDPGIGRVAADGGFVYRKADGSLVKDEATLGRIRSLAVPPAWTSVWICSDPHGHLQAVGRDARGRKQYRYHPRWREARDEAKYDSLLPESERETNHVIVAMVKQVAERLGNTPAVCRNCYVHPEVLDAFREGRLQALEER